MLNKIKLDVDVQVWFVDVFVDEFRLVVIQHSRHCSPLEYPKDVPEKKTLINQQTTIRQFSRFSPLFSAVLSFEGVTVELEKNIDDVNVCFVFEKKRQLTCIVIIISRIGIRERTEHVRLLFSVVFFQEDQDEVYSNNVEA